jgi:archaeosortase A (PGF-CTERM-specific)
MRDPVGIVVYSFASSFGVANITMQLIIGGIGVAFLAMGFHKKNGNYISEFSAIGWILVGLFFYLYSEHYVEIEDPVLILMTAAALPCGIALAFWEVSVKEKIPESLLWLKGCVVWSMIPYYLVYSIPILNMAFVYTTAISTEIVLEFVGLGSYQSASMRIDLYGGGDIPVSEWEGNRWILSEPLGEAGFFVPMEKADGTPVSIIFILACSALQSMIIFVGAIVALSSVSWKRRLRALIISIPTIYILNVFRNVGIVWLTDTYVNWSLYGIDMFNFTHSYAAKFISLFAMFLMAIVLFDLLPELHKNVIKILNPIMKIIENITNWFVYLFSPKVIK